MNSVPRVYERFLYVPGPLSQKFALTEPDLEPAGYVDDATATHVPEDPLNLSM